MLLRISKVQTWNFGFHGGRPNLYPFPPSDQYHALTQAFLPLFNPFFCYIRFYHHVLCVIRLSLCETPSSI